MLTSIYNYIFGYIKVNCVNCNREMMVQQKYFTHTTNISCSHGCTFEYFNKSIKKDEKN
jgi:hypothetical protein